MGNGRDGFNFLGVGNTKRDKKGAFTFSIGSDFGALGVASINPSGTNVPNAVHLYSTTDVDLRYQFPGTDFGVGAQFSSTNYVKDGARPNLWGNGFNTGGLFRADENGNTQISAEGLNAREFMAGPEFRSENFYANVRGGVNTLTSMPINIFGYGFNLPVTSRNSFALGAEAGVKFGRTFLEAETTFYSAGDLSFTGALPANHASGQIGYNILDKPIARVAFYAGAGYNWNGNYAQVVDALGSQIAAQQGVPYTNIGAPNLGRSVNFFVGIRADIGGRGALNPNSISFNEDEMLRNSAMLSPEQLAEKAKEAAAGLTGGAVSPASPESPVISSPPVLTANAPQNQAADKAR